MTPGDKVGGNCPHTELGACSFCWTASQKRVEEMEAKYQTKDSEYCALYAKHGSQSVELWNLQNTNAELQVKVEELEKYNENLTETMMENQDKACFGHIEEVKELKVQVEAGRKCAEALAFRFDEDGRCMICGFNVGGCAKSCEADEALALSKKSGLIE